MYNAAAVTIPYKRLVIQQFSFLINLALPGDDYMQ